MTPMATPQLHATPARVASLQHQRVPPNAVLVQLGKLPMPGAAQTVPLDSTMMTVTHRLHARIVQQEVTVA